MNPILQMIKEAVSSKKFVVTVASVIASAAMKIGLELPTETVALVVGPVVAYLLAQGWADQGKEMAKVQGTVALAIDNKVSRTEVEEKLT